MSARRRFSLVSVLVLVLVTLVVAACGGDGDDPGDEESFCLLAASSDPVAEADAETMGRLAELAPPEIRQQVAVVRALADQVDGLGERDPDRLAAEFEVRFSDEYVEARTAIEEYQRTECDDEVGSVRTTATSDGSVTTSTSDAATGSDETGDDGG